MKKYQKGKKLNYDYLLALNKYSTRTYNDLTQYPIFPWLTLDHNKIQEILIFYGLNIDNYFYLKLKIINFI